jgi:hypothetical protein
MRRNQRVAISFSAVVLASLAFLAWWVTRSRFPGVRQVSLSGVVLAHDDDPKKQLAIPNAEIVVSARGNSVSVKSGASGLFHATLKPGIQAGESVTIKITHRDYETFEATQPARDELLVVRLTPVSRETSARPNRSAVPIRDVRLRYTVKFTNTRSLSSAAQPFEIVNKGNVPCNHREPCSPDGKWKAAIGTVSLDAGEGNEFTNARLSCVAGPCPFTRIESDNLARPGRNLHATIRNWSDTATFLVEAEVTRTMTSDMVRQSYPIIFGTAMEFTLPANAEGPCIEAEVSGTEIVYPLSIDVPLSWAECTVDVAGDHKLYQCELKPGYVFR